MEVDSRSGILGWMEVKQGWTKGLVRGTEDTFTLKGLKNGNRHWKILEAKTVRENMLVTSVNMQNALRFCSCALFGDY